MYSELLWGENYGDTVRVTLWWTFYLRSESSETRRPHRHGMHAHACMHACRANKDKVTG